MQTTEKGFERYRSIHVHSVGQSYSALCRFVSASGHDFIFDLDDMWHTITDVIECTINFYRFPRSCTNSRCADSNLSPRWCIDDSVYAEIVAAEIFRGKRGYTISVFSAAPCRVASSREKRCGTLIWFIYFYRSQILDIHDIHTIKYLQFTYDYNMLCVAFMPWIYLLKKT